MTTTKPRKRSSKNVKPINPKIDKEVLAAAKEEWSKQARRGSPSGTALRKASDADLTQSFQQAARDIVAAAAAPDAEPLPPLDFRVSDEAGKSDVIGVVPNSLAKTETVTYPTTWWDAFKERWFPKWLMVDGIDPVQYTTHTFKVVEPDETAPADFFQFTGARIDPNHKRNRGSSEACTTA